jgi:hypothetical protein
MTLEEINYISQTVAVVAILGSFVAVLIQMRQTNRLLRSQAQRAQIDGIKYLSEAMYQTPALAEIMARAGPKGLEVLSMPERIQLFGFLMVAERTWEAMYVQYKDGLIDEAMWQSHFRQARAAWRDFPATQEFWSMRRDFFMPEYRAFRESQMQNGAGSADESDTLGYAPKAPAPAVAVMPAEAQPVSEKDSS